MSTKTKLGWEHKLRLEHYNTRSAVELGNFTHLYVNKDQTHAGDIHANFAALGGTDDASDAIKQINIDAAQGNQTIMKDATDDIAKLKGTDPNPSAWRTEIEKCRVDAKAGAVELVDKTFDKAVDTISILPPSQQQAAADVFSAGYDMVKAVFGQVVEQLQNVVNSVVDFLKGVWNELESAYNVVAAAASSAIDFIKGLFSFSPQAVAVSSNKSGLGGPVTGQGLIDGAIHLGQEDLEGFLNFFVVAYGQYRKGLPDHGHQIPLKV